jgi:hypothetical protein
MARFITIIVGLLSVVAIPLPARSQPLGTFRWQLQPYCNIVSVVVTQTGGIYRLEGTDDQCGGGSDQASVIGTAFRNPDGTIGFGLNIVTSPGGRPLPVDAEITMATLSGTWRDSAGNSGTFRFTPGAGTGGTPRPASSDSIIPTAFVLNQDGGFLARGTFGTGNIPGSGLGARMMWHPAKAAFRAGEATIPVWDDVNVGVYSTALGFNSLAAGPFSVALGGANQALGPSSTALGNNTVASAGFSTAMGSNTAASGLASTALGAGTKAIGDYSVAAGSNSGATASASFAMGNGALASGAASVAFGTVSQANGVNSVAMGVRVGAGGDFSVVLGSDAVSQAAASGSFIFADHSTLNDFVGFAPNEFLVRAAGGVGFYTNPALTTGLRLAPSGSQWLGVSDVNTKENFREIPGEDVLDKIARMPVREWGYKAQDASIRHMGPTAQDFHAAFGLGEDPLRIGTMDADGVALAGVKALESRTRNWSEERSALVAELDRLKAENATLGARLAAIEEVLARLAADQRR